MTENNDEQLIKQYLDGDEKALEILVQKYLKQIYNFVFRMTRNAHDAEDIAQEVFLKTWKNLKKFDKNKSFKAWLFRIAKNASIDFLRKKKIIPFSDFSNDDGENMIAENIIDEAPLPDEIFERKDLAQTLTKATDKLPLNYRAVLYLYYNNQLTFQEIADSLDEPMNTIKSRHRRALAMLRKMLIV